MWSIIALLTIIIFTASIILNQPQFGKNPDYKNDEKIKNSTNFIDGKFKNISETPIYTGNRNIFIEVIKILLSKIENRYPIDPIPCIKTNLKNLDTDILIWFGHSSYFIQLESKKILVDPVLCGYAAPFKSINKAFKGSNCYNTEDIPDIDYLFISHDHYDHLDYETILKLKDKIKKVICPLGVGSHLRFWGYTKEKIIELDWYEKAELNENTDLEIYATPARHFSGRGLKRNKTLWSSFVLKTPKMKIFIGGDGGYDIHFKDIGNKFGPFDLAILELGQYNENWKYIHLLPTYFCQAAKDLKTKKVLPVHNSKFALGKHSWYEPLEIISKLYKDSNIIILTPIIGEPLSLNDSTQTFNRWWENKK